MAVAGPSVLPDTTPSYDDDLIVALTLQLEELEFESGSRKGKEREGKISDRHVALQEYKDLLLSMHQLHTDQRMAQSIADAVHQDAATIAELVAVEATAARDREQALQLGYLTPHTDFENFYSAPASPSLRSIKSFYSDDAESVSAFADYEHQTTFPGYVLDDEFQDPRASSSRRPQEKAIQYYTGPKLQCSICFSVVPEGHAARCPCNHIYCTECLRSYAFKAMKDESIYPLKCCKIKVPENIIAKILSLSEYQKYQEAGIEYSTTNRIYCPNKECFQFIPPEFADERSNYAFCRHCTTIVCTRCKDLWHTGACKVDFSLQAVIHTAGQEGWRQCFKCKRMIELSRGCHHMTCHCKAEFCYVCGVEWKNCQCDLFEEQRLYDDAAARVDQAAVEPLAPAVRANRIIQVQQQIRDNHACEHAGRFQRRTEWRIDGHRCEICDVRHWKYILACRHCRLLVCEECRRFRV